MIARCLVVLVGAALLAAGCGAPGADGLERQTAVRLRTFAASDWQAGDLHLDVQEGGASPSVRLSAAGAGPVRTLLLEMEFDAAWQAANLRSNLPPGALNLIVSDQPGLLAVGVVLPEAATLQAGSLLSFDLAPAGAAVRQGRAAPQAEYGRVDNLAASLVSNELNLAWSYRNNGDCDQNSEVNVADLTALASRLRETTTDGDQDEIDEVLDVDGNTEINPADLTGIGINYRARVSGYKVYRADGPDTATAASTLVGTVDFPAGSPNPRTRRTFSLSLDATHLGADKFYFVRADDSAEDSAGAASNVVSGDLTPPAPAKFRVPPAGVQAPDAADSLSPSLVLMPAIPGVAEAGAPVIVYLVAGGAAGLATLSLAYYGDAGWTTQDISSGVNYSHPQAVFTGTAGLVLAFDTLAQEMKLLRFDSNWVSSGGAETADSAPGGGALLTHADADYAATTGRLGFIHAYTAAAGVAVRFAEFDGATWSSTPVYAGAAANEIVGGATFRYDPLGGDPWCAFSSGVVDADLANTTFLIDTTLRLGRLNGGSWTVNPLTYPDSPLGVDLGFTEAGVARLALFAARDYHLDLTLFGMGSYDLSLLYDGVAGDWNGTSFSFDKAFTSEIQLGFQGFPPTEFNVGLDLATGASVAGSGAVCYAVNGGTINFDTSLAPTGGSLAPRSYFCTASGGGFDLSTFFTEPGRNFCWAATADGSLAAAYLEGVQLDSTNISDAGAGLASPLLYWTP